MLNIFNKVKFLKKIEKTYRISLFLPSTVSFAMNNRNHEGQVANGNININNAANNSHENEKYSNIVDRANKEFFGSCNSKFTFKEFLGKGSFGEVILVEREIIEKGKKISKQFALKVTKNTDRDYCELNVLDKIKKYIVCSYGVVGLRGNNNPEENRLIFILEYCKYGNINNFMKNILKRYTMSETLICYMAGQIVNALKFMHSCKFAHFDVKPQNILVDECLNFKLSDFSTSYKCDEDLEKYDQNLMKYEYLGSGPYMAPEVLKKSLIKNPKNFFKPDVFSLGVMCYKLFTMDYPYFKVGNTYVDRNVEIDYLTSIERNNINLQNLGYFGASDVFKDFLLKCLEKDVDKRPDIFQLEKHPFIMQYKIILNEKEKLYNGNHFLTDIMTDHIKVYNDECKKYGLKDGILTLKNNKNEFENKDLGDIIDNNFAPKKGKIKDVFKKNFKEKRSKKMKIGKN